MLNLLGVILFYPFTGLFAAAIVRLSADFGEQVAFIHTGFNILSSLAVMPVLNLYARLIAFLVPGPKGGK